MLYSVYDVVYLKLKMFVFGSDRALYDDFEIQSPEGLPDLHGRTSMSARRFVWDMMKRSRVNSMLTAEIPEKTEVVVSDADQTTYDLATSHARDRVKNGRDKGAREIMRDVTGQVLKECPFDHSTIGEGTFFDTKPHVYGAGRALKDPVWDAFHNDGQGAYSTHNYDIMVLAQDPNLIRPINYDVDFFTGGRKPSVLSQIDLFGTIGRLILIDYYFFKKQVEEFRVRIKAEGLRNDYQDEVLRVLNEKVSAGHTEQSLSRFDITGGFLNLADFYFGLAFMVPKLFYNQFGREPTYEECMEVFDSTYHLVNIIAGMHFEDFIKYRSSLKNTDPSRVGGLWLMNPDQFVIGRTPNGKLSLWPRSTALASYVKKSDTPQLSCPFRPLNRKVFGEIREHMADIFLYLQDFGNTMSFLATLEGFHDNNIKYE